MDLPQRYTIVATLILILLIPFQILIYTAPFYNILYGFSGTYDSIESFDASDYTHQIISFFTYRSSTIPFLQSDEFQHMTDVRFVFALIHIFSILLIIFLYTQREIITKKFLNTAAKRGILASGFLLILMFLSFNQLFTLMHYIFFPQGNWSFPPDSQLIQLLPLEFFNLFAIVIFVIFLLTNLCLYFLTLTKNL